jgi:hypothetical protein
MLSLDDNRWGTLTGAYRMKCDPRPLLAKLESGRDRATTWHELWDELHHQGGVGDASYRTKGENRKVPEWFEKDYFRSIQELAQLGISEISRTDEREAVRAILSVVAIIKGLRTHGRFLLEYEEDELLDMESRL